MNNSDQTENIPGASGKAAEEVLRESEERYRVQFEQAMDAILLADVETGVLLDCNIEAEKLFERSKSEIVGQHQNFLHQREEVIDGVSKTFKEHIERPSSDLLDDKIITGSGQIKYVAIRAGMIILKGKRVLQGIFRDVTELTLMRKKIDGQYSTLKGIMESSSDAIFSVDREYRYTSFNRSHAVIMKAIYGFDIEIGKNLLEYMTVENDRQQAHKNIDLALRGEKIVESTLSGEEKRSRLYFEVVHNPIFDPGGTVIGAAVFAKDLTEQHRLRASLVHSEKMAAVGQLAGGIAHEINNPVGVILGFAQSIVKKIDQNNVLYMPLKSIEREAVRCKKLIVDLLTFSRTAKAEPEMIDINEVIDGALNLIEVQAMARNIRIIKEYDLNLPRVKASKKSVQEVIINLSNNAIDAMPNSGELRITTFRDHVKGDYVRVEVKDSGTGIPANILPRIFEPFFTTKEVGKGTGLGLSLCYEIMKDHKGDISVETKEGEFTKFVLTFPTNQPI